MMGALILIKRWDGGIWVASKIRATARMTVLKSKLKQPKWKTVGARMMKKSDSCQVHYRGGSAAMIVLCWNASSARQFQRSGFPVQGVSGGKISVYWIDNRRQPVSINGDRLTSTLDEILGYCVDRRKDFACRFKERLVFCGVIVIK